MAEYQVLIDRRVRVADDVTRQELHDEILATLLDVDNAPCRTVNGLRYVPVGPIALEVTALAHEPIDGVQDVSGHCEGRED